jgi:hypothetical protein
LKPGSYFAAGFLEAILEPGFFFAAGFLEGESLGAPAGLRNPFSGKKTGFMGKKTCLMMLLLARLNRLGKAGLLA